MPAGASSLLLLQAMRQCDKIQRLHQRLREGPKVQLLSVITNADSSTAHGACRRVPANASTLKQCEKVISYSGAISECEKGQKYNF